MDTNTILAPEKPAKPAEIKFNPEDPIHRQLAGEYEDFKVAGQDFVKQHPDFQQRLSNAAARGLTLDNRAHRQIMRSAAPEILYYLADPKNEVEARNVMNLSGPLQEIEITRIANHLADVRAISGKDRAKM